MTSLAFWILFGAMFCFMGAMRRGRRRWHRHQDRRDDGVDRDVRQLGDHLAAMSLRVDRLEEERDFYKDLLGSESSFRRVAAAREREPVDD